MSVGFLSESEELMNLEHVLENQTGMVNKCVRLSQAWELLLNAICISVPSGVVTTYCAQGQTKRGFSVAVVLGNSTMVRTRTHAPVRFHHKRFGIGNILSPQTFQARDAADHRQAKVVAWCLSAGAIVGVGYFPISPYMQTQSVSEEDLWRGKIVQ